MYKHVHGHILATRAYSEPTDLTELMSAITAYMRSRFKMRGKSLAELFWEQTASMHIGSTDSEIHCQHHLIIELKLP